MKSRPNLTQPGVRCQKWIPCARKAAAEANGAAARSAQVQTAKGYSYAALVNVCSAI